MSYFRAFFAACDDRKSAPEPGWEEHRRVIERSARSGAADAISELLRPRPLPEYLDWLETVPRQEQYTSAVVVGELYKGAFRTADRDRHLRNIEDRVLPSVTSLPYDIAVARVFGQVRAHLEDLGQVLPDADLHIAATALHHGLELVTGNLRHFERGPKLEICRALDEARP